MEESMSKIDSSVKEGAYHAWLGYYNSIREIGRDKTTLVELANQFSESIGLHKPPSLFRKTALKMGLKDIPGIRIRRSYLLGALMHASCWLVLLRFNLC
jgi:ATP-dependent RNA helicase MSS116